MAKSDRIRLNGCGLALVTCLQGVQAWPWFARPGDKPAIAETLKHEQQQRWTDLYTALLTYVFLTAAWHEDLQKKSLHTAGKLSFDKGTASLA